MYGHSRARACGRRFAHRFIVQVIRSTTLDHSTILNFFLFFVCSPAVIRLLGHFYAHATTTLNVLMICVQLTPDDRILYKASGALKLRFSCLAQLTPKVFWAPARYLCCSLTNPKIFLALRSWDASSPAMLI